LPILFFGLVFEKRAVQLLNFKIMKSKIITSVRLTGSGHEYKRINYKSMSKKIGLLLAIVGATVLLSCEGPQGETGPDSAVYEYQNVSFNPNNQYTFSRQINTKLEDNVLIYRLSGVINSSTPIWQLVPRTIYFDNGDEFDYDYDFSRVDFTIYVGGNYDYTTETFLLNNQTFRIVVIPGQFANKGTKNTLDLSNYKAIIKAYHIDESKIKTLQ
jgi:hypothetical protein